MLRTPGRRQAGLYVALLTITLLLLAFSASAPITELRRGVGFAMAPIQNVLRESGQTVSSLFATLGEIDRLRQQNQQLTTQVDELATQNRSLESLQSQNQQLTDILDVRSALDYESTAAEVISRRITDQEHVISLDRGANFGIEVDDPVIGGGGGLVGQGVGVGADNFPVALLTGTPAKGVGPLASRRGGGGGPGRLQRPRGREG